MDDIVDINTLFGPMPDSSVDLPVDALLALMQKHRVGAACTLSTLGLLLDPAVGNAATRAACEEHTELLPVATLNPTLYFGDETTVTRLKADGFRMVRFFPVAQGWPVEFAPFQVLLQALGTTGLPVMLDVKSPGEITTLLRVLKAYPGSVILSGVTSALLAETVTALRANPNWHIEISCLLAPGCLRVVTETLGVERLLFGTGAPAHPIASALHTLQHAGLEDAARRQILAANARRILN
jgi:predicted TIM-barrel fold metal-dependent hydrolase